MYTFLHGLVDHHCSHYGPLPSKIWVDHDVPIKIAAYIYIYIKEIAQIAHFPEKNMGATKNTRPWLVNIGVCTGRFIGDYYNPYSKSRMPIYYLTFHGKAGVVFMTKSRGFQLQITKSTRRQSMALGLTSLHHNELSECLLQRRQQWHDQCVSRCGALCPDDGWWLVQGYHPFFRGRIDENPWTGNLLYAVSGNGIAEGFGHCSHWSFFPFWNHIKW